MSGKFCRSVSSSTYSETGGSSGAALATTIVNGTNSSGSGRYISTTPSASVNSSTSSRERGSVDAAAAAADIISRYSPAGYVPSIQRQQQQTSGGSAHHWKHRSTSSSLSELFGGDEREVERKDLRLESSLSSSSTSSSVATGAAGLWSKSSKRRPSTNSTVLTTVGHSRTDGAVSLAEVTTIDDHVTRKSNDDDDDDDDGNDGTKDDHHNNNGNAGNTGHDGNGEDIACEYGVNNNDNEHDDNDVDGDDDENEDEDNDANDDDNLNNCHHRFHQQRRHRPNKVSPAKRNVLSPAAAIAAGGLIGVGSLDLLTNLATNPHNTELLINNNAQDKVTGREEKNEVSTNDEVTRGIDDVPSIVFLQRDRVSDIPEDGEEENSASNNTDENGFRGTINNIAGRPSVAHGDDPSIPSTSRRTDQPGLFSCTTGNSLTSSPTNPSTAHQSIYRGVNEQYVSTLVKEVIRSGTEQHRLCLIFDIY